MEQIKINRLPGQTWNKLKMNFTQADKKDFEGRLPENALENGTESARTAEVYHKETEFRTGLGEEFSQLLAECGFENTSCLKTEEYGKKTYRIYLHREGKDQCRVYGMRAEQGSELTVYMYVGNDSEVGTGRAGIQTLIEAGSGAKVKLVQIIDAGAETEVLNDIGAELSENAQLVVDQIFLGGKRIVSGTFAALKGRKADFQNNIAYYMREGQDLDINVISSQTAKKTRSEIDVKGVLDKGARKLLRATIDFISGCSGSVGKENEDVLLLDENVENKTIPLILCSEEDVEGQHGASIGKIDEKAVFYLKSRGLPEDRIYDIMAAARIETILGRIGDDETTEKVRASYEGRKLNG
ncbi:MAG: SufD family Fe-S cluster assembly protein [Lachnospiraceae bacterium]|nr:SufD family Fe-S cluster assembly protein [Lachnospiraceae bacterium]